MNLFGDKTRKAFVVAISLAVGFAAGLTSSELFGDKNSAQANEGAIVPVQKVEYQTNNRPKMNRSIAHNLWDVYVDPVFVPADWSIFKPLPLVPLISFEPDKAKVQTIDADTELHVLAQVPGMDENDVKVQASERSVHIRAHKIKEEKTDDGEFQSIEESFEQSVHLPCKVDADKVKATVKDGVLTVVLPKMRCRPET